MYSDFIRHKMISNKSGIIATAIGYPCVLSDSKGYSLKNYTIHGNEQGAIGEVSRNLFDESLLLENASVTKTDIGYEIPLYPATYDNSSSLVQHVKSVLKPNTTYTFSRIYDGINYNLSSTVRFIDNNGKILFGTSQYNGLRSSTFSLTEEQINGLSKIQFWGLAKGVGGTFRNMQLEEGGSVTPYIPYTNNNNKFCVPIITRGKNLLAYPFFQTTETLESVTWTDNGDGSITASGTPTSFTRFAFAYSMRGIIKPNTEYAFSSNSENASNVLFYITLFDGKGTQTRAISGVQNIYFTPGENEEQISIRVQKKSDNVPVTGTFRPQLEAGTVSTSYEKYSTPRITTIELDSQIQEGQSINYKYDGLPKIPTFKGTTILESSTEIKPQSIEAKYVKE